MKQSLYQAIAQTVDAYKTCVKSKNDWMIHHKDSIARMENTLPSGSGVDNGTHINIESTTLHSRIVLASSFHVMDENGFYDGWIDFEVIVKPSLFCDFVLNIRGRFIDRKGVVKKDCSDIKEYLYDLYNDALRMEWGK